MKRLPVIAAVLLLFGGAPFACADPATQETLLDVLAELQAIRIHVEDARIVEAENEQAKYNLFCYGLFCLAFIMGLDSLLPRPR